MNKKALSLAVCIAISYPGAGLALGLGEIESVSNLNQPFKAKIDLLSVGDTNVGSLKVKVASPSVFSRVGIDRPNFLNGLRFRSSMENGKPVILVSSSQPIKEPFINFLLEVSWPKGQLLKEYTVLLDPPVLMQPGTSIASNTVGVRPDPSQRNQAQIQQQNSAQQSRQQQQRQRVIAQQQQTRAQQQRQRQLQQQRQQQANNDGLRRPGPPVGAAAVPRANNTGNESRTYRIRRGDTLYKVAKKLGYNGVRNEQMMMAIFEANPTAFRKRNINNLKSGVTVRRPSVNEAKRIPLRAARQDIRTQTSEWKRGKPVKSSVANNNKTPSGKVTAKGNPTTSQARIEVLGSTKGNNSANNGNLVGQAKLDDLNRQMTLASESLTARKRENNELKSRVSELEALLKKKNRLITLKNEQLAELQVSLGKPPTAMGATDTDVVGTINEQGGEIEKMLAQDGNDGTIVRSQDPAASLDNDLTQNTDTEIFQEPISDDITTAMGSSQPVEEEGGILDLLSSPLVMGLGGGSLLALIAGFLFLRRRNSSDEYDDYSPIDFEDPSLAPGSSGFDDVAGKVDPVSDADDPFAGLGGSSSPVDNSGFDVDPMDEMIQEEAPDAKVNVASTPAAVSSTADNVDDDDILQEADVYIVYGLHEQAEVELKRAIEKHPDNLEYRAKLLENYHASDNKEAFEVAATEFSKLNGPDKDALWEKISGWGGKMLPASPLFASPGVAAVINDTASKPTEIATDAISDSKESSGKLGIAAAAAAAGGVAITAGKAFADNAKDKLEDTVSGAQDSAGSTIADVADSKGAEVLDFDDMDLDSLLSADDAKVAVSEATSIDAPKVDLDNGFEDADLDFAIQDMAKQDESSGAAIASTAAAETSDNNEMDFDFSEFEIDGGETADKVTSLGEEAGSNDFESLDDFDFGLDEAETSKDELSSTNLNLALDGSDTGVGKILPENSVYKMSETKESKDDILGEMDDDLSFLDLDNGADTGLMEAQVSTKLDLARAYMDMGDVEGARSTLEEVMAEGNDDQKKEAKELLHQTG